MKLNDALELIAYCHLNISNIKAMLCALNICRKAKNYENISSQIITFPPKYKKLPTKY